MAGRCHEWSAPSFALLAGLVCACGPSGAFLDDGDESGEDGGESDLPEASPLPEPIVWYRFEGNGDDEIGDNHADPGWAYIPYAQGYEGQAARLSFESGHYDASVFAEEFEALAASSSLTVAVRLRWGQSDTPWYEQTFIALEGSNSTFSLQTRENRLYVGGSWTWLDMPSLATWHELVFVFRPHEVAVYVDGEQRGQASAYSSVGEPEFLMLGARPNHAGHFYGRLDDIRFYDRALSEDEATALSILGD